MGQNTQSVTDTSFDKDVMNHHSGTGQISGPNGVRPCRALSPKLRRNAE